jgi:hypothetical protein
MKKLVLLFIIGVLITASCTNDSEADLTAEIVDNMKQMQDLVNTKGKGTYDMVWIVNKAIVDTATLSTEWDSKYIVISHLPDTYLFHDNLGKYSFNYDIIKDYQPSYGHTKQSYWYVNTSFVGISTSNAYFSNSVMTPVTYFLYDGIVVGFMPYFGSDLSIIYDTQKDVWSGSVSLDSCKFFNVEKGEPNKYIFSPPLNLSFQTTGKKKK